MLVRCRSLLRHARNDSAERISRYHRAMGSRWFIVLIALAAGCEKKKPRLEGPIDLELGDCAATTTTWVSGPRPMEFDRAEIENRQIAARDPKKKDVPTEDPPPPEEDDPAAGSGEGGAFATLTGTGDISSGFDDENIYGGLLGNEAGEMNGGFGFGRSGFGPGGGGTGWGTIGTGRYGVIGRGSGTGSGYGVGGGRGGMRGRNSSVPAVTIGQPSAQGDLDKAIIRRYIKRNLQKITYCYEKELLVNSKLAGTVMITFFIQPTGKVAQATATGVNGNVAKCVAAVIKGIEFPKPKNGGGVQVNYPFTFRPANGDPSTPPPATPPDSGGTGTAMALEEGKMGTKDSDRAEGQYKMKKEPLDPALAAKVGAPYKPGADSPLRPIAKELEECFRMQTKRHGIAVIDIAPDTLIAHGIENAEFKKCVAGLAKKVVNKQVQRCSIAFGPMPAGELPGVEITASDVKFLGNKVAGTTDVLMDEKSFKIAALFEAADNRHKAMIVSKTPVALHGPLLVKPLDATPMRVVNMAYRSLVMAGEHPVLAVQRGSEWKPLRELSALPIIPVPVGTGGSWNTPKPPSRDLAILSDEQVRISILVTEKQIWVGLARVNEFQEIVGHDLVKLAVTLDGHKKSAFFVDRTDIEIAGDDKVPYKNVVEVIEAAAKAGFVSWEFNDPMGLSARPQL
jgi:hypothetical protein